MLTLPIKKKWFDMILSGEKEENIEKLNRITYQSLENYFDMGIILMKGTIHTKKDMQQKGKKYYSTMDIMKLLHLLSPFAHILLVQEIKNEERKRQKIFYPEGAGNFEGK